MEPGAHRDLKVLEAVAQNQAITQRSLAAKLGIALGLTNLYLKRLVRKGCIKCVNVRSNRFRYLITPKGIAEKTRLTYEFMDYSLHLYRQARQHLRAAVQPVDGMPRRVAIYGTGEAAELTYLSLKEQGIEPIAVFDGTHGGRFLGIQVLPIAEHLTVVYDVLVLASLDPPDALLEALDALGVPRAKVLPLRPPRDTDGKRTRSRPTPVGATASAK